VRVSGPPAHPPVPRVTTAEAGAVLFVDAAPRPPGCADGGDEAEIRCLLAARFASDPAAAALASSLYASTGDVAGLSREENMEGGFRGMIHLVPELPVGARRKHLGWVVEAATDYDVFFRDLASIDAGALPYRWRALTFRFMRSQHRTTPSAYAEGWAVSYNVDGSLNTSAEAVREILFHEIFHLNDAAHGDWSPRALGPTFDAIVRRCGSSLACLAPYAPTDTRVRGGTYYAFQPNNGAAVHEYAAELALRYYREERAAMRGESKGKPFKCGPEENQRSWSLLTTEFFGGVDRTKGCE
jgi:hypothetical protein